MYNVKVNTERYGLHAGDRRKRRIIIIMQKDHIISQRDIYCIWNRMCRLSVRQNKNQAKRKQSTLFIYTFAFLNFAFEIETNEMWLCLEFKSLNFHVLWFMFQMTTFSCRSNCVLELRCTIYAEESLSINCFDDKTLLTFNARNKMRKKHIINNGSEFIFTCQMHEPIHIDDRNFRISRHFLHLLFFTAFCLTADIHTHTHIPNEYFKMQWERQHMHLSLWCQENILITTKSKAFNVIRRSFTFNCWLGIETECFILYFFHSF